MSNKPPENYQALLLLVKMLREQFNTLEVTLERLEREVKNLHPRNSYTPIKEIFRNSPLIKSVANRMVATIEHRLGISTAEELVARYTLESLRKHKHLGEKTLMTLREHLAKRGFTIRL